MLSAIMPSIMAEHEKRKFRRVAAVGAAVAGVSLYAYAAKTVLEGNSNASRAVSSAEHKLNFPCPTTDQVASAQVVLSRKAASTEVPIVDWTNPANVALVKHSSTIVEEDTTCNSIVSAANHEYKKIGYKIAVGTLLAPAVAFEGVFAVGLYAAIGGFDHLKDPQVKKREKTRKREEKNRRREILWAKKQESDDQAIQRKQQKDEAFPQSLSVLEAKRIEKITEMSNHLVLQ